MKCLYVSEKRSENLDAECCKPEGKRSDVGSRESVDVRKKPVGKGTVGHVPLQTSVEKNNGSTKAIKSAINAALGSLPAAEALTTAGEEWLLNIEAVWL